MCGLDMRNQTVLVTGGTSGIGLSVAIYLKYLGYTVYVTSRNPERYDLKGLEKTFIMQNNFKVPKKILSNLDVILNEINFVKLDITASQSIDELVTKIESEVNMVDILINNVGFSTFSSIEENDYDLVKAMFDTNIVGPIHLIQKVLPKMRENKSGRIINITSMSGYQALPFMGIYAATKAAIMRMSEALYLECKHFNIKISSLVLGTFKTNFNSNMIALNQSKPQKITSLMDDPTPIPNNSPYSPLAKKVWIFTESFFSEGTIPLKAAKKTFRIIKKKNPKINYQSSRFSEAVLNSLRKFGSTQFFLKLLGWFFKS